MADLHAPAPLANLQSLTQLLLPVRGVDCVQQTTPKKKTNFEVAGTQAHATDLETKMVEKIEKNLVIFTPLALNVAKEVPASMNETCELFAQNLAARVQTKLQLSSIATKAIGGKTLDTTIENVERALKLADLAFIVVPGSQINLLDAIYPFLMVYTTLNSEWLSRINLVCLGDFEADAGKFDTSIFENSPVIFSASSTDWPSESENWNRIIQFINRKCLSVFI